MHPQLFGGLTLVSLVRDEHLAQILPLEFADSFLIGNARRMHLRHKDFQFSFHRHLRLRGEDRR
jgi:hypothetical protein